MDPITIYQIIKFRTKKFALIHSSLWVNYI